MGFLSSIGSALGSIGSAISPIAGAVSPALKAGLGLAGVLAGRQTAKEQGRNQLEASRLSAASQIPGMWPYAEPYARDVLWKAGDIYADQGFAPAPDPLVLSGRESMLEYGVGELPELTEAAQKSWMSGLGLEQNPYLDDMVSAAQKDLIQAYQRDVLPYISDSAQASGGYGGSRQGVAEGIASEGLEEALGDVSTKIRGDAWRDMLGQQKSAWSAAPAMAGLGFLPAQTQLDVGGMRTQDQTLPAANLAGYQAVISPYSKISRPGGVSYPTTPSQTMATLGGGLAGLGIAPWINSAFAENDEDAVPPPVPIGPDDLLGNQGFAAQASSPFDIYR